MDPDEARITRTDFPVADLGYDPEAVDAHLRSVEAQIRNPPPELTAEVVGDRVARIVELAESQAAGAEDLLRDRARAIVSGGRDAIRQEAERAEAALDRLAREAAEVRALVETLGEGTFQRIRAVSGRPVGPEPAEAPPAVSTPPAQPADEAGAGEDLARARLAATRMAIEGVPRDQADRELAEEYEVSDRTALLDEVYERVRD